MGHGHNHSQHHSHTNQKLLRQAFFIITGYMFVEFIGGIITNSLALLSDAGHMLSDSVALLLSLLAFWLSIKPANSTKSYGYKRAEILASLLNGLTLILIAIGIIYEGIKRIYYPPEIYGLGMFWIAIIGLLVNIIAAFILMKGDKDNLNLKSAFLHVIGDLLGSIGAIVASLLIYLFGWKIADPIASLLVAILILVGGIRVTFSSIHILMEGVPTNIKLDNVRNAILQLPEIETIHDLHVWSITSDVSALSCHVVINKDKATENDVIINNIKKIIKENFGIKHSTIQIEKEDICESGDSCDGNTHLQTEHH
ncbi:zinc transporter ZitB [Vulcanibacillus modesticaldus]|uniref:Zinc transporter ZitB n=1 Tax=Vulcanibacillus modesticaldus TaxID=337097 RepID=A0A1D2YVB0_9BACI|nr:cation diffusion facilitator family transporter [Vulcanibacillus modesticaldus]OEF99597.1 zinc transporter ZitB [Vulcanibacillus modesticaldus]